MPEIETVEETETKAIETKASVARQRITPKGQTETVIDVFVYRDDVETKITLNVFGFIVEDAI